MRKFYLSGENYWRRGEYILKDVKNPQNFFKRLNTLSEDKKHVINCKRVRKLFIFFKVINTNLDNFYFLFFSSQIFLEIFASFWVTLIILEKFSSIFDSVPFIAAKNHL